MSVGIRQASARTRRFSAPPDLPSLALWLDADDAATWDGTTWTDKSGQGNHVTHVAGVAPTRAGSQNSRTTMVMTGGRLAGSANLFGSAISLYAAFVKVGSPATFEGHPFGLWTSNQFARYNAELWVGNINTPSGWTNIKTQTSFCVLSIIAADATNTATEWKDGTLVQSLTSFSGAWSASTVSIGNRADAAVPFGGHVGEIIAYSAAHDATERSAVESYLRTRWGTP